VFYIFLKMNTIVTVFKDELSGKENVLGVIELLADHITQVAEAIVIVPKAGKLANLLNELTDNGIAYGTHFNTAARNLSPEA
jgi:hypothetical protein